MPGMHFFTSTFMMLAMFFQPAPALRPKHQPARHNFHHMIASWYGGLFHGKKTASGEIFDMNKLTAASKTLPLGTHLLVENPATGASCVFKVNDRGPYV